MRGDEYPQESSERDPRRPDGGRALAHRQEVIEKALSHLDNELDRLAETLTPVLDAERPFPALAGGGSSDEPGSDLGRALEHYGARINALASRLSYLTDRIDL